jgi:hypothetical protein
MKTGVRDLLSRQLPISKGDFIGACVKFSLCVFSDALKRLSIKAFINFAKVQLQQRRAEEVGAGRSRLHQEGQ